MLRRAEVCWASPPQTLVPQQKGLFPTRLADRATVERASQETVDAIACTGQTLNDKYSESRSRPCFRKLRLCCLEYKIPPLKLWLEIDCTN